MTAKEKNDLRARCAQNICAFLGYDRRSLAIYGTSYGFSVDSFRGTSPLFNTVKKLLDSKGVLFTVAAGSFHDEIRISTRGKNLEKFEELADHCWENGVMKLEGAKLEELRELASRVDCSSEFKLSPLNTLVRTPQTVAERIERFKVRREWFDVQTEIDSLKAFLPFQNNVEAVLAEIKRIKSLPGMEGCTKVNMGIRLRLDDEYERLTGKRLD